MEEAGLGDEPSYLTNAVKHFKYEPAERGKRRIHKSPSLREVSACRPWLDAELRLLEPELVVALGATAARALLGSSFRVTKDRGTPLPLPLPASDADTSAPDGERQATVVATLHPSAILRADDRESAYEGLVADLRTAARALEEHAGKG